MKIKNKIFNSKKSKYSDAFYKDIFLRSSVFIMLISLLLLLFFTGQTISNQMKEAQANIATENDNCYSTLEETLENAKRITMFFALYKDISPLFQLETDLDIRKTMLQEEARTFTTCFDYIHSIKVDTPETLITQGGNADVEFDEIQFLDPFTLSTTTDSFPPLIKLSYTSANLDTFSSEITLFSKYLSIHYMTENSYLLSTDGIVVLANDYHVIGEHISDVLPVDFEAIEKQSTYGKYLQAQQRLTEDGMILVTLTPKAEIYKAIVVQLLSLILIYFIIVAIGILILSFVLGRIYRPIKDVAQVLKYHMPDNDSMLESDASFIKECMQRYGTTEEIDAALLQIRKSQLSTLHSQISPHLLGNTLEAIKCDIIDKLGFNTKLEHAIGSLTLFLNESYEYQQMITSIGAEIERTKYFADMMVYCFFERLNIEWHVEESVLNSAIVTLTLQPFIENCIEHGFTRMEENPLISIRIGESEYQDIYIEIEDNGMGMSQETLDSIKASLSDDANVHKHIGIKNSHLKLKLLFGDDYGVTDIHSNEGGTYVKLMLPKIIVPTSLHTENKIH